MTAPALAPDAAMAVGIASTAMPFARTPQAEAERWLRILLSRGEAGVALQALGVSEAPLRASEGNDHPHAEPAGLVGDGDPVTRVIERSVLIAGERGATAVATTDVLLAVMAVYGDAFDRVLQAHGAERAELIDRLSHSGTRPPALQSD